MLASLFVFCFYFLRKNIIKSIKVVIILVVCLQSYFFLVGDTSGGILGLTNFMYGGDTYQAGMDYRLIQLGLLLNRLIESPMLGVGFGYYNEGYLTYGQLAKPYLLELDFLNFISKIGLLGSFFYALGYFLLFRLVKLIENKDIRRLATSLFVSLIALIIYSTGQTAHQAVFYWILLAFSYGFVVSHLRKQG